MPEYRKGGHSVYDIQYPFVWATKYRYPVLRAEVAERTRDSIKQMCMSRDITIVQGHVSGAHETGWAGCLFSVSGKMVAYIRCLHAGPPSKPASTSTPLVRQ